MPVLKPLHCSTAFALVVIDVLLLLGCSPDGGSSGDLSSGEEVSEPADVHPEPDVAMESGTATDTNADDETDAVTAADLETDSPASGDSDLDIEEDSDAAPWPLGPRTASGRAYFFDMPTLGQIVQVTDVAGAEVYVYEAPHLRVTLEAADDHVFTIEGIPDGVEVTIALEHEDYYPNLTATLPVDGGNLEGLTFQALTHDLVALGNTVLGVDDPYDPDLCGMATTVTAISDNQHTIWAVGEPGVTVTLDPSVAPEVGPFYFNESVLPERRLTETTRDGGVMVIGAEHGIYLWTGHKEGLTFRQLKLRCVGGFATNASPPWGLQAIGPE